MATLEIKATTETTAFKNYIEIIGARENNLKKYQNANLFL